MSAIGGILNFDERPLETSDLIRLWELLKDRGPDGGNIARDGLSGGVCYHAFHLNSQSRAEIQPYVARDGRIMVGDLRLDNRDELIVQLRHILDNRFTKVTDIELAMAAHQQWGDEFPLHLIGEFALILINRANRTWLLARDHIGARPLYYSHNRERFICSSTIVSLLQDDSIPRRLNEEYIADFLAYIPEPGSTAFKDIHSVKPGCILTVTADGRIGQRRYWKLDPDKTIQFKTDEEYEEAFIELFSKAVRAALRSDRTVVADLSGGLDSSSVACMAHQLLRNSDAEAPDLETVSLVYDESRTCDERKFIGYVEDHTGRKSNHLREDDYPILSLAAREPSIGGPSLFYPFREYHRAKRQLMEKVGARVALCGRGGDQILNSNSDPSPELADLLKLRKPRQLHQRLGAWSESLHKPYVALVWQSLIFPSLPLNLQVRCKPNHRSRPAPWIDNSFARRLNLVERRGAPPDEFGFRLPSERDQVRGFLSVTRGIAVTHDYGLENVWVSYPYLYRPLVEFMQAIPFSQKVRPGQTRSLLRRSLRNVLPPQTLARKGKKTPMEAMIRALNRESERLRITLTNPLVCAHGFANAEQLLEALERAKLGHDLAAIDVINMVCLELWLRALEKHRPLVSTNNETLAHAAAAGLLKNNSVSVSQTLSNNALRDHAR